VLSVRVRSAQVLLGLLSFVTPAHAEVETSTRVAETGTAEPAAAFVPMPAPLRTDSDSRPRPLLQLGAHLGMGELRLSFDRYGAWGRSHSIGVFAGVQPSHKLLLFAALYNAHAFEPSSSYRGLTDL